MPQTPDKRKVENDAAEPVAVAEPVDISTSLSMAVDHSKLDKALVGGVAWTASGKWLSQLITWTTTLIVARLLAPSDYGMVGMAVLCLGLVTLFSEFGLGTAIVTLRDLSDDQISQLNTLSLLLGLIGFSICLAAANPIGKFFKTTGLPLVVKVMSLAFVISAVRTVPYSLLQKNMRFKLLAVIDGLQSLVQAISTLLFAFLGFGYWALVLGNLSVSVASTGLTLIWKRQHFAWPRLSMLREPLVFSWHLVVATLGWYIYDNSDFLIAGRVLGPSPLGVYTMAWTLAHSPVDKLTVVVNRVTPSILSSAQLDFGALRRYLRTITEGLALIVFPATLGMALVANEFVHVALGLKWGGVVLPLELLALHAVIRSNVVLVVPFLNVIRETRFVMWNSLAALIILPASFYVGSRWGTGGIAGVWVFVYPFLQIPFYWRLFQRINMSIADYLQALWPALSGCILMAIAIELVKRQFSPDSPTYLQLATEIIVGAVVYAVFLTSVHQSRLRVFLQLVNNFRYNKT